MSVQLSAMNPSRVRAPQALVLTPVLASILAPLLTLVMLLAGALAGSGSASAAAGAAQAASGFYKGRQVSVIVGYGPGGGYDTYGRLVARHIGRYLPGQPKIVVQNMPGAGSLVATSYLYRIAPKDGSVFGIIARNMPLVGLLGTRQSVEFDPLRFTWLGSSTSFQNDAYVLLVRKTSAVQSIADIRKPGVPPLVLGSTAEGASSDAMPAVMRQLMGLNIKTIGGYADSGRLFLAMTNGEIEARTVGLSAVRANRPDWLALHGPMRILIVFGRATRHPDYPDVPTARELANGDRERRLIEAIELPYKFARPFAAPPGVPADRAKTLQSAFMSVHGDSLFLADAAKTGIDISPVGAQQVRDNIRRLAQTPPEMLRAIEKLLEAR